MKTEGYTEIICRGFCSYFKEGKEELKCGGYQFLMDNFTVSELNGLMDLVGKTEGLKKLIPPDNEELFDLVCSRCDFRIDGCDYREDRSGPPCGGFILIDRLTKS